MAVPEARVAAGSTLAGFRLERRLGKGGMGEVYLAQQLSVDRQVAVKILPPGFAENPEAVKRFLHEGKLAAKLDHANIVTVHEAGEDSGNYYLAMAYVECESLDQRLAKSLGEENGMTLSGSILGTPQYMSPEQAQCLADLGVPTDAYALGATLYHLVTGSPPFTRETTLTVLHKHLYDPLPPPRSRNPRVTEACSHLIETMMAKQPTERYSDWRALVADIDRVLQGKASARNPLEPAVRPGSAGAPAVSPAVSKAELARQQQASAPKNRLRRPWPLSQPSARG